MRSERGSRRRGAALVLVMAFAVGALALVGTLLTLSTSGARAAGEAERQTELQTVVRAAIAASLNEMNRNSFGAYDPGGDGVGALTRPGASGPNDGVPVTITTSSGTRTIGAYRTTVRDVGGRKVLTVVAAWPSFTAPPGQRLLAAAELEVSSSRQSDLRPIQIDGPVESGRIQISVHNAGQLNVSGIDATSADPANVPAANVAWPDALAEFNADFVARADSFVGANPGDPGGPAVNGASTVTNTPARTLSQQSMDDARVFYAGYLDGILDDPGSYTTLAGGNQNDVGDIGNGTFVVPGNMQIRHDFSGSGTLIVQNQLHLDSSARVVWNGDIYIAGYNNVTHDITGGSQVQLATGASIQVTGNVIMLGENTQLQSDGGNAGGTAVDGALLMLSEPGTNAQVQVSSGSDLTVKGLWGVYAHQIQWQASSGSKTAVNALSFVLENPDPEHNQLQIDLQQGSRTTLQYDNVQVTEAIDGIAAALGPSINGRLEAKSYWERGAKGVLDEQQTQVGGSATAAFGVDYTGTNGPWGRQ